MRHSKLTHEMLRIIGVMHSNIQVEFDEATLQKGTLLGKPDLINLIGKLIENELVVRVPKGEDTLFTLTQEGRSVAVKWQASVIAMTPPLPTFKELREQIEVSRKKPGL